MSITALNYFFSGKDMVGKQMSYFSCGQMCGAPKLLLRPGKVTSIGKVLAVEFIPCAKGKSETSIIKP
jgi:hypothetical protein